jgi:hypothetical protein
LPADRVREIIDGLIGKGIVYVIGLYSYLCSLETYSIISTLEPAFGRAIAEKVSSEITNAFKGISLYTKVKIGDSEIYLVDYLRKYILNEHVYQGLLEEIGKRFNSISNDERKVLSIASAIINAIKDKDYPALYVKKDEYGLSVNSTDYEHFSDVVSSILGFEINVRPLFYKYLLGFNCDQESRRHTYYSLMIYPFAEPYIERLASEARNYVKIPDKSEVEGKLNELYRNGDFLKLSLIFHVSTPYDNWWILNFLMHFSGIPDERMLCNSAVIEDIYINCFVNPLVYGYVKNAIETIYKNALNELMRAFKGIFEKAGYNSLCIDNCCAFTKDSARPVYMCFSPWPDPNVGSEASSRCTVPGCVSVAVVQGMSSQLILKYFEGRDERALWLFTHKNRVVVIPTTYKEDNHREVIDVLRRGGFSVGFLGSFTKEVTATQQSPVQPVGQQGVSAASTFVSVKPTREVLEGIVARVLEDLGFKVQTDAKLRAKGGEIEVDDWAEKRVGDLVFRVYVSCKNWDRDVDRQVVDQEFGRVLQLDNMPHLRVLVVKSLTDPARKAALDDGFFVIELGEKASTENAEEIYNIVYKRFRELFLGIAPDKVRDIINRLGAIMKDLEELTK